MSDPAPPGTREQRVRADAPDVLEALLTAAGEHLEPVLDVGTTAGGDLLLVLPEPAARLADLLASSRPPALGEAVTVLVPLAQALQRLHDAGVAHGAAGPASVVVDAHGSPAWSLTADPVLLRRAGPAGFSAAVDADRAAFATFAESLVARSGGRIAAGGLPTDRLVDALFDLADPVPLRLEPEAEPVAAWPPARLLDPVAAEAGEAHPGREPVPARLEAALAGVRRRVWVAAGAVVVALAAALVLLPGGGTADARDAPRAAAPAPRAASPSPSAPVAGRALDGRAALPRLLAARAACLARSDGACLDRVVAAGSPLRSADRTAITAGTEAVRASGARIRVVSDGGGTVVADVGGATVVAVREPDGWRLRDVVAEPPR